MSLPFHEIYKRLVNKYVQMRRAIHPAYKPNPQQDVHWPRVVEVVEQLGAEPELYIEAQFADIDNPLGFPPIQCLYSDGAKAKYLRFAPQWRGQVRETHATFINYLQNFTMRAHRDLDEVLLDPATPFHAYFRVLMCSERALPDILKRFGEVARRHISLQPDLFDYLAQHHHDRLITLIPAGLPGRTPGPSTSMPGPSPAPDGRFNFPGRLRSARSSRAVSGRA